MLKVNSLKMIDVGFNLYANINIDTIPRMLAYQLHYQLYKKLIEVLDVVFNGYTTRDYTFIPPDDHLVELYNNLRRIYLLIDLRTELKKLKVTELRLFKFSNNYLDNIDLWLKLRNEYIKDINYLSNLVQIKYPVPVDLQLTFIELDKLLEIHQAKKDDLLKIKTFFNAKELLNFGANKSITKTIFTMLFQANGEWVKVKHMSKKVDRRDSYVRIVISQIKKKIINENKQNIIKIEPSRESSYRLIVS
jgi:hypothetical protein